MCVSVETFSLRMGMRGLAVSLLAVGLHGLASAAVDAIPCDRSTIGTGYKNGLLPCFGTQSVVYASADPVFDRTQWIWRNQAQFNPLTARRGVGDETSSFRTYPDGPGGAYSWGQLSVFGSQGSLASLAVTNLVTLDANPHFGQAGAEVDIARGVVSASSSGWSGSGSGNVTYRDVVRFSGSDLQAGSAVKVSLHVQGDIGSLSASGNSALGQFSLETCSANSLCSGVAGQLTYFRMIGPIDEVWTGLVPVNPDGAGNWDQTVKLLVALSTGVNGSGAQNLHATLSFDLPGGVSYESGSGLLLAQTVPEPTAALMLIAGLTCLFLGRRRFSRRACA